MAIKIEVVLTRVANTLLDIEVKQVIKMNTEAQKSFLYI